MKPSTQIEISAQVWVCDACGGHDPKSCGCNSPAHWEKLLENREKKRKQKQKERAEKKANENNGGVAGDTNIENTRESGNGSARLVEPITPTIPAAADDVPSSAHSPFYYEKARIVRAWADASNGAKLEFVRERWDEISMARKQLDAAERDEDRWIEGDDVQ